MITRLDIVLSEPVCPCEKGKSALVYGIMLREGPAEFLIFAHCKTCGAKVEQSHPAVEARVSLVDVTHR